MSDRKELYPNSNQSNQTDNPQYIDPISLAESGAKSPEIANVWRKYGKKYQLAKTAIEDSLAIGLTTDDVYRVLVDKHLEVSGGLMSYVTIFRSMGELDEADLVLQFNRELVLLAKGNKKEPPIATSPENSTLTPPSRRSSEFSRLENNSSYAQLIKIINQLEWVSLPDVTSPQLRILGVKLGGATNVVEAELRKQRNEALISGESIDHELVSNVESLIELAEQWAKLIKLEKNRRGEEDASTLTWEELYEEIQSRNMDVYDHAQYISPSPGVDTRNQELYLAFHARKKAQPGETFEEMMERIGYVVKIQITKAADMNQEEGSIPTCSRDKLFDELLKRNVSRTQLLMATTYHPVHGEIMREMLSDLILRIIRSDPPELRYENLCGDSDIGGRAIIERFLERQWKDRILALYPDDNQAERNKKAEEVLLLTRTLFYLFDLLTVAYTELMKNTKTIAHNTKSSGKDYPLLSRPGVTAVHRTQRYDTPEDPSALYLALLTHIPDDWGRIPKNVPFDVESRKKMWLQVIGKQYKELNHSERRQFANTDFNNINEFKEGIRKLYREKLVKIRNDLLALQDCYYPVEHFSKENGIPPSSWNDPLFPDMLSFLTLGVGERLVFDGQVWGNDGSGGSHYKYLGQVGEMAYVEYYPDGRPAGPQRPLDEMVFGPQLYLVALSGWETLLSEFYRDLPQRVTHDQIVEGAINAEGKKTFGYIPNFIKLVGRAKMFPGNHLRRALVPMLTQYIYRLFARYPATDESRKRTFKAVVRRLRGATQDGGLSAYSEEIEQVINFISDNSGGEKMGKGLLLSKHLRREQREAWLRKKFEEDGIPVPPRGVGAKSWSSLLGKIDRVRYYEQGRFWKMVDGELALPGVGINRLGSNWQINVDRQHGGGS